MAPNLDLEPATIRMTKLIDGLPDGALTDPTPCAQYAVADLLDHIGGAVLAFRAAAVKQPLPGGPSGDAANLGDDWRTRIPRDLAALADTWRDPEAWTGMTGAGGVELPGDVAGVVALDELVIHGWDLARATGQPSGYDGPGLDAVLETVTFFRSSGIEGIFGPPIGVPDAASKLDRILGITGRDPNWTP